MKKTLLKPGLILLSPFIFFVGSCNESQSAGLQKEKSNLVAEQKTMTQEVAARDTFVDPKTDLITQRTLDTADYNSRMLQISNNDKKGKWPVNGPYPLPGALLPFNRLVAYYGNLYSKKMGILGELPKDAMLKKLQGEVERWKAADSLTPVIPCLHYIAITAQGSAGADGKHRLRMPSKQIDTVLAWAKEINGLVFLDIQVANSSLKTEVPTLEKYLKLPNVHFGIDPEFSLKNGETPGTKIGTFNEEDINYTIDYLGDLVRKYNLPPKVLVIHRFTQGMITNYDKIKKTPEVQIVIDMDGWGSKILKKSTWDRYIYKEPVQFTGFKLFYKNDVKRSNSGMYTPEELLKFTPKPIYIQYQ
jgi:hypothetical protein